MRVLGVILMAGLLGNMPPADAQQQAQPQVYVGKDGRKYQREMGPSPSDFFNVPGFKESMEGRAVDAAQKAYERGQLDQDQMMSIILPAIQSFKNKSFNGGT